MSDHRVVGSSVKRRDLYEKVTGAAVYTVDVVSPGTLHAKVVRSDRAHALIDAVDREAALASPGVAAVVVAEDLAGLFARFGHIVADHCVLATGKARYYGEPVALVLGETPAAAADGAELVKVSYTELPAVLSAAEALADGAPLVHELRPPSTPDESFAAMAAGAGETGEGTPATDNVAHEASLEWGDVTAAQEQASVVVASTARFPMLYAYAMEPYNAVASFENGRLHVTSSAQHPFMVRADLARIFGLPLTKVTVTAPYLGGGYGSKSYTKVEPLAAVGSWLTGRPVKVVLDVEGAIYTTRADSAEVSVRSGFTADGTLVFREFDIVLDSGAYADNSPLVLAKAVNRCFGPYRVPNLRVRGRSLYTNISPASSYRGFGTPQGAFAGELNLDRAAAELGIDPFALRRRNLAKPGEEIVRGKRGVDADLIADLAMLETSLREGERAESGYGVGVGCTASDAGAFPVSTAQVRIQTDGSVVVASGSTEMGQGSRSALAQIAAEELGVELGVVEVIQAGSAGPYERTTGASRTTTLAGIAVQRACADALGKLRDMAAEVTGTNPGDWSAADGTMRSLDQTTLGYGEIISRWFGANAGEVTGVGLVRREGATAEMPPFWEIGMVGVGVSVDPDTGVVTVEQLATIADVGFAINPQAVEGQDLGAATQGLGGALYEELVYDGPQLLNPNIVEYRVPRIGDMPRRIDTMLAERHDGIGPYGAKGAGEGALNPMGSAVASAVARAVGRWPDRLPLTPERVWRLMNDLPEIDDD
ncbi:xanthine dehydrogenase family protein molybdopterin-binding subunit [Amycolatopsis sp. FDAARGOS 1241]|uniref:xanthine dehydrogenase family protein molybdopterin-binding subunit n=1 Tax=Amycolatopsis sp. FDAARGOS 1241 TaxID=2778070 RepID=UPI00195008B0|nr:xanthine dehydrogenase family protein molybdopterin-binding subunit [Amycolatopsis sp. FDAARGOS 1241]QRP48656.1 xanthine dehydrogenase family protein molybdopterin-binding subunit [Amycolatopsis sp. FDAARGOS 1241]